MTLELIAKAIAVVTIIVYLCYLLYKHYRRKKAMHRLILQYMQDSFQNEYEYMETCKAIIRKACKKNAKKKFRKKG